MSTILVDAHAHLHPAHSVSKGLDAAKESFDRARRGIPNGAEGEDCLIFVDHPHAEGFRRLLESEAPGWTATRLNGCTLRAFRSRDGASLLIFAGRQVRADNGLEVLALLVGDNISDGGDLRTTTERVLAAGGVAAIPWGFGKWMGARGREVRALLRTAAEGSLYLVDSSIRPPGPFWSGGREFRLAEELGVPVLAGSDPLRLAGDECRLGCFGFMIRDRLDLDHPAQSLRRMLTSTTRSPGTFGARETLIRGLRLQLTLRLRR